MHYTFVFLGNNWLQGCKLSSYHSKRIVAWVRALSSLICFNNPSIDISKIYQHIRSIDFDVIP